jgi:restriction system protein
VAIPDFQTLMLPVLQKAVQGEVRISDVVDQIADDLGLSVEERGQLLPPDGRLHLPIG